MNINSYQIEKNYKYEKIYNPALTLSERNKLYKGWELAVKSTKYDGRTRNEK